MLLFYKILTVFIISFLPYSLYAETPTASTQTQCLQYFAGSNLNFVDRSSSTEQSVSDRISNSSPENWAPQNQVFSDTLVATIVNGVAWLTAVQILKSFFVPSGHPVITKAFLVTVPTDVVLTLLSHYISLGKIPLLKKFAEGRFLKKEYEYYSRTFANTLISSSVILASWATAGININSKTIAAALILCGGVYATLQLTKPYLLKTLPAKKGVKDFQKLKQDFSESLQQWQQAAYKEQERLEVTTPQMEAHFVFALESLILNIDYESRMPRTFHMPLMLRLYKIKELKQQIQDQHDPKIALKLALNLKTQRRHLLEQLVAYYHTTQDAKILAVLKIDNDLGELGSLKLHEFLQTSYKERRRLLYASSLVDQALAVGIAGGVLLYSTTHWAANGVLPLFLQGLF